MSKYGDFSGPYFPVFGLYLSTLSPNAGKYGPDKAPYLDTFHAVLEAYAALNYNPVIIKKQTQELFSMPRRLFDLSSRRL